MFSLKKAQKGFVYTLLVVLIFFLVMSAVGSFSQERIVKESLDVASVKAVSLREFSRSIQADGDSAILAAAYFGTNASSAYVSLNRTYLTDNGLLEFITNGTVNGNTTFAGGAETHNISTNTRNSSANSWLSSTAEEAALRNYNMTYISQRAALSQDSAFTLLFFYNVTIGLNDSSTSTTYTKTYAYNRSFNISGFWEPLEPVESDGAYNKTVNVWPYASNYNFTVLVGNNTMQSGGNDWVYANVSKISDMDTPGCGHATIMAGDYTKILVVNNATVILTNCPSTINNKFVGLIAEEGAPGSLTIPYVITSLPVYSNSTYDAITEDGSPYLLLNGAYKQVVDMDGLLEMIEGSYYRETDMGPSYLDRLKGSYSGADVYGMESFIHDGGTSRQPWVDWEYYSGIYCDSVDPLGVPCFKVKGTTNCHNSTECSNVAISHFRVDNATVLINSSTARLSYYGFESLPGLLVPD